MTQSIPSIKLNNGYEMPIFGLGTWKSKPGEVEQAVQNAIEAGYRHIDGAMVYQNEKEVGSAIHTKINDGTVSRKDLFIVSKLWNSNHHPDYVLPACKKTMEDLGLDYLDLYLIHWPMGFKEGGSLFPVDENGKTLYSDVDFVDTWKAMEELVKLGLVRSIGVSNFSSEQIKRVLEIATIKPVNNQVECHPYLNQKKLIEFCNKLDITVTAYSPLGSPDRPWAKPGEPNLLQDPKLIELATRLGKSVAQVLLRYQVQRNVIAIPKTVSKQRLAENINIFDFTLSAEDMSYIDSFDCKGRLCGGEWDGHHPHYPFHVEF